MQIYYLDNAPEPVINILRKHIPQGIGLVTSRDDDDYPTRVRKAREAQFWLVGQAPVDKALIQQCSNTLLIQKAGIGCDKIDTKAAREADIPVAITSGANADSVAEHTILLILALLRRLIRANDSIRQGEWAQWELRTTTCDLMGKTVGLVGLGNIGQAVARRLQAFGVKVIYYDPDRKPTALEKELKVTFTTLEDLVAQSNIISLHAVLHKSNENLITFELLQKTKPGTVLINTARAKIVHEDGLIRALEQKVIAGAGIDVFAQEPLPAQHRLRELDNVILTPHSAPTATAISNVFRVAIANIQRVANGLEPLDVIN